MAGQIVLLAQLLGEKTNEAGDPATNISYPAHFLVLATLTILPLLFVAA